MESARPAAPPEAATAPALPGDPLERILMRVRLRAQRRAHWLRGLWQSEADIARPRGISHAAADACLESWDAPAAEQAWQATGGARELAEPLGLVEAALRADTSSRLCQLERIFGLDAEESDLLQACLAAALDPSLARGFAYLQDHAARSYVTAELVERLFDHGRRRVFAPESALRRWQLVSAEPVGPGEPAALTLDPLVRDWLCGQHRLDEELVDVARIRAPLPPLEGWPVDELATRLRRALDGDEHTAPTSVRLRIAGSAGSGRRTLAACVAAALGLPLLVVDADRISGEDWSRAFLRAQRQAFLDGCALAWIGESLAQRPWPDWIAGFPVQFLIAEPASAQPPAPPAAAIDVVFEMPVPQLAQRQALWRAFVPAARTWSDDATATLAARYRPTLAEMAELGRTPIATPGEAAAQVRESSRHRLGELACFVECPFVWDDLVLPRSLLDALGDFAFEAQDRVAFWEQKAARRLFPQGQGLFALLVGPPGTGKTMAAQVVAAELGLDLFRISLAAVVSKYVGETSKNLQRILSRAEHMDVVLLFDEADALFGKRTDINDAHDRFANTDTDYLLQAIEAYRGIALLATNKRANVDAAFVRRLRYVLEFPKPDAAQRRELWRRLVAELAGAERAQVLDSELALLAQSIETTGAQIKYAVLAALFSARRATEPLGLAHLVHGLERELLKEGRALNERDRERLLRR